jgi:hypothetical protein
VVVLLLAGCGGAYDALGDAEAAYVIPGSEAWGAGDPCATADCGVVVVDELADASWMPSRGVGEESVDLGKRPTLTTAITVTTESPLGLTPANCSVDGARTCDPR